MSTQAPQTPANFEVEHWYQPSRGKPEAVWSRYQFTTRAAAEARIVYLTGVAESTDRPPPGMARPTRLRLVERVELADVRPMVPGRKVEPPMAETSVGWRTWRGAAVPQARVNTEALELSDTADAEAV
jgi:hypothetical protein